MEWIALGIAIYWFLNRQYEHGKKDARLEAEYEEESRKWDEAEDH